MPTSAEVDRTAPTRPGEWRRIAVLLARGTMLALVVAVAAAVAAFVVARATPPIYQAEVGVIVSQPSLRYDDLRVFVAPAVDASVYRNVLLEGGVVLRAFERHTGTRPNEAELVRFLDRMRVRVDEGTRSSTLWIEVGDRSPTGAAGLANAIAEELVAWDRARGERALERSVIAIESALEDLAAERSAATAAGDTARVAALDALGAQRRSELMLAREVSSASVVVGMLEVVRAAVPPERPIGPATVATTAIAAVLGLLLGYGLQVGLAVVDPRLGDRHEAARETGLRVLAEFPSEVRGRRATIADAAGFLRTGVDVATDPLHPRTVLVTCPVHPSEKSGVALALAESYARSGVRTLLVDADLRFRRLTEGFDLVPNSTPTFEAALRGDDPSAMSVQVTMRGGRTFDLLPSWDEPRFATDLLNEAFRDRLAAWAAAYDVIVLDAAPVVPFADATIMAPHAAGTVVCAHRSRSRRDRVRETVGTLRHAEASLLGIVLTGARTASAATRERDRSRRTASSDGEPRYRLRIRTTPVASGVGAHRRS